MKEREDDQLSRQFQDMPREVAPGRDLWPDIDLATRDLHRQPRATRILRMPPARTLAAAAVVVAVVSLVALLVQRPKDSAPAIAVWTVETLDGGSETTGLKRTVRAGDALSTGSGERLLATTDIGEVVVEPSTDVRLKLVSDEQQILALNSGEIYARIVAPPRVFVVETPTVTAIDLGCEYRLSIDEAGYGRLEVFAGWVALEHNQREWYVPAGAVAAIDGDSGPAAPYFTDATDEFKGAADRYAATHSSADFQTMLSSARPFESLTLWHIAFDASLDQRGAIFDTMSRLGLIPDDFDREDFVTMRPAAMDWLSAHLQQSSWFRPDLFFGSNDDLTQTRKRP